MKAVLELLMLIDFPYFFQSYGDHYLFASPSNFLMLWEVSLNCDFIGGSQIGFYRHKCITAK